MRDDPPRVGRPRKGTQKKSRERYKAANIANAFQLDDDVDFQAPSDSRGTRRAASPINVLTSPTSISSTAMSMDSASSDINPYEENDSSHAGPDALCAFCNCGSEMAQILGQLSRYYQSPNFDPFKYEEESRASHSRDPYIDRLNEKPKDSTDVLTTAPLRTEKRSVGRPPGRKKKRGRHPLVKQQHLTADMSTFGSANRPEISDVFDSDGCIWAHHCCAAWSAGVCQTDSYDLENVDKAAFKAISEQCCHCRRHGASVECQIQKCTRLYHYPCCASAGAFQDIKSMVLLCPDHLDHAMRLAGSEATCVLCDKAGDIAKQLFCTSCGRHYHGKCLDPPVSISSIVRMGWQCPECKVCQGCRQPGDDEKMLFCDECDKGFHTYCLSPPMSSVPKTAWKCYRCRKCEDCGSNVPGSGPSCRWHFNYTVCDRCYQQRKKSTLPCCPMCGKAIRNMSGDISRQCLNCAKYVHVRCDKEIGADKVEYYCLNCRKEPFQDDDSEFSNFLDHKEESNDSLLLSPVHSSTNDLDAEYLGQRTVTIAEAEAISRTATGFLHREPSPLLKQNEMEDLDLKGMDINFDEVMMESGLHGPLIHDLDELKPDSSDSFSSPPHISSSASYSHQFSSSDDRHNLSRVTSSATSRAGRGKKKMSPFRCRGRPPGSTGRGKKSKGQQRPGRPRSKSTSNSGPNKENIQTGIIATTDNSKKDEADDDAEGLHSTVIMVSTKDRFSLGQDICMCCGSFGKGSEGHLIACAHCGQCFHPYCVNIKINKVLMTKGWRCLDCTVCEGCGKNEDEGKLLLCDGCDISYHIYCLDPPLDEVPPDGWKCQWCVECTSCGSTNPGVGCKWMSSYTQCGPCASETSCCVCNKTYLDDELVIKCTHCYRWLHADCDGLASEDDSELAASYGYHCCLCRDKTGHFGIFSSSWTKIIEKGVYTGSNKQTIQTVIVTQTTTTVMATGVSNRKSKILSSVSTNHAPITKQGLRQPLHPVQTSVQGTFEVKLPGLRMKSRRNEINEPDSVSLTEKGLKEIKSMIVKAPGRGHARNKDKATKISSSDLKLGERETKTSGQLTKTTACSEDIGESRQPVCLATGQNEAEEYHEESEVENRVVQDKRMPGRPPNDKKHEKKFHDKRDDPIDFFGTSLLKISRKKRKKDSQTDNDTQSSEDEMNKNENMAAIVQQPHNQPSHLSAVASYPELAISEQQSTTTTVSQHGSWPSKISAGMTVDPLSDEMQHSDSLYKTLNMLVSGPEDVESQPDQHQTPQKTQQHYGSSKQHSTARHGGRSTLVEHSSGITQNTDLTPTGDDLIGGDLIGLSDLPHVEGHEVEEIFAGIEREMSVDGTPRSQDQSPLETSLNEFPKSESSNFNREQIKSIENKQNQFQSQATMKNVTTTSDPTLSSGFTDAQQRAQHSQQDYRQYEMYRNDPSFQTPYDQGPGQSKQLGSHSGETDAFKAVFGEEPEIKSKSRDGANSPKIDGQKQLRKWEQDEKLGELATISPVLYANIVHPELKIDYPEWPNRARAIARLWRKLPQEQREPFRLRARDNRVKQKDQGRKLGNFKKPSSTPTTDNNIAFSNASPSLPSDSNDKVVVQSTAETTAIDVLSNNLILNGESNSTGLIRTQMYSQNVSHSYTNKQENQTLEASSGYSHESNPSFGQDEHSVFRQNHGQFMTSDEHMNDPMLLQTRSSSVVSPSITSLQKSQQSISNSRILSDTNSKTFSLSDLCSPSTPSEMHFPAPGLTPTTPVFPSSPFQTISYGTDATGSPAGFISPSLPLEGNLAEKKKAKKQGKLSKEQLEIEKEKKKKKLAVEQEKERQWKVLQQQRLKEQQVYQQTPAIQQVLMMKEQMKKDNNKPSKRSQINIGLEDDNSSAALQSNVLPPVEPFTLTSNRNVEDKSKAVSITKQSATGSNPNIPATKEHTNMTMPSSFAGHMEYFKDDINIPTDQASIDKTLFLTKDSESHMGSKVQADIHAPASPLDRLLDISNSEFAKMNERPDIDADNKTNTSTQHHALASISNSTVQHWVTSSDMSSYTTSPSYPIQPNTDQISKTKIQSTKEQMTEFQQNKDRIPLDSSLIHGQHSLPITLPEQQVPISDISGQSENSSIPIGKNNQPAKPGFNMVPGQVIPHIPVNVPDSMEKPTGFEQQQQQQALLFQQQQFMAAQQQYIQWQLQQRNPELFQSMAAPMQYSSYTDKDLPEVDSEEQHQERIRFLYRQRQMQKQQVVQIQQQLQQHQIIAQQQVTQGSTSSNPVRPQIDTAQQHFMQQLLQQQQQTPEALQQQFVMEYNRQMQQRAEAGQNVMQYDKFMAELAQQYGYSMQTSNAHTVSLMQHGMAWQGATPQGMNPNAQQMFSYGIDEEKAKDLTPQQLYQLQLQHTLMMHQMAASGMYQPPASTRNQSPLPAGSRKGTTSSNQDRNKKSRELKKGMSQEKLTKPETQQGSEQLQDVSKQSTMSSKSSEIAQVQIVREVDSSRSSPSVSTFNSKTSANQDGSSANTAVIKTSTPIIDNTADNMATKQVTVIQSSSKESSVSSGYGSTSIADANATLTRKGTENIYDKKLIKTVEFVNRQASLEQSPLAQNAVASSVSMASRTSGMNEMRLNTLKQNLIGKSDSVVNHSLDAARNIYEYQNAKVTDMDKHSGDRLQTISSKSNDTNTEKTRQNVICSDGIHCGTDSEDESHETKQNIAAPKQSSGLSGVGNTATDSHRPTTVLKAVCSDGIHCGTDSEDDEYDKMVIKKRRKPVCSDGVHCGTDSEDEECREETFPPNRVKSVCSDGIHCGTDSEDENQTTTLKKKVCSDGIHCGTDSEDEDSNTLKNQTSEENNGRNKTTNVNRTTCSDGIHCGTDSEEENEPNSKSRMLEVTDGNVSLETKSNEKPRKNVCSDGIHCGTDSENEEENGKSYRNDPKDLPEKQPNPSQVSRENKSGITPQPGQISTSVARSSIFSPEQTLEVIQEGDVTVNTFGTMDIGLSESKNDTKISNSVDKSFTLSSGNVPQMSTTITNVKDEHNKMSACAQDQQQRSEISQQFIQPLKKPDVPNLSAVTSRFQNIQSTNDIQQSIAENTSVISSSKLQENEPQMQQQQQPRENQQQIMQQQMFSPTPSTASSHQDAQSRQRPKFAGIPPMSPQYQKVFLHQHQLLIMQFQQYQYQLQAQFQQLSQQQMSPQQQFLLQQQYHQQIVLLQRQFVQQQAQLQAMASAGMQFTEQELNFMYQQQMVTQQSYNHWIATLSLDQQGQLHARMQANMQQVQQAMAAAMQNASKNASEPTKDKAKKPRGRRPRKNKTESSDPATPAPNTPSLPPTPASGGEAALPSTPNKDQTSAPDFMNRNRNQRQMYPTDGHSFPGSNIPNQGSQVPQGLMHDKRTIQPNQLEEQSNAYAPVTMQQPAPGQLQSADQNQVFPDEKAQSLPTYHQSQSNINQHTIPMQSRDWQQMQVNDSRHLNRQQQQSDIALQQQDKPMTEQTPNSQHSQLPRVDIIPGDSNPFSDVYREMENKSKLVPSHIEKTVIDQRTGKPVQGTHHYPQEQWKNAKTENFQQPGSGNSTPRISSAAVHSETAFYYPSPSGNPPSIPQQPHSTPAYPAKPRGHMAGSLAQPTSDAHNMYPEQLTSKNPYENTQAQFFNHQNRDAQSSQLQIPANFNQNQNSNQITNIPQYPSQSSIMSQLDSNAVPPGYEPHAVTGHGQRSSVVIDEVQNSNWAVPLNEQPYANATHGRQLSTSRLQNASSANTDIDAAQAQHQAQHQLQTNNTVLSNERLMPPPKYENATDKSDLPPYPLNINQHTQIHKPDSDYDITNRLNNIGGIESKEQSKPGPKRKRSGQPTQMATANVDFSLLNSEEQKRFIVERKREDFERRRRIVEDQKQQKIKEQRNFKTANRKIDKKVPRTKQQRKLKVGREKLPADKSPLPTRIVIDDKSLKLPLCEPEVHLLYPLVQPYGSGYSNGDALLFGVFGNARVQGTNDHYSQFPSPDPPVTSSNPPTPPASLPPSPGTINQSLRDSLQMIPTEGIFDDIGMAKRPKDDLTLFGGDLDRQSTSFYSPAGQSSSSVEPHSKDDVMVTLTMSSGSNRTPNDRVSNVANILGVAKPNRIKVTEETSSDCSKPDVDSVNPRPLATSIGKEKDVHFSCLDSKNNSNDPDKNKAPFCKHCDISIQGSGYIECKDGQMIDETSLIKVENLTYKKIPINSGQELFDVFCSQMCLRSFHSLSKPGRNSDALCNEPTDTDGSGQLIDPVRSVIPVSTGEASSIDFSRIDAEDVEMRGTRQAEPISHRISRRRSLNEGRLEHDSKRPRFVIWKRWRIEFSPKQGKKDSVQTSVIDLLEKYGAALKVEEDTKDDRKCMLCGDKGDGVTEGTARLINYDVDEWVHLNCALWSLEVYETLNGALHNVQKAYERGIQTACVYCGRKGATVTCARVIGAQMRRCDMNYHFNCAIKAHCVFFKDKTVLCPQHKNYGSIDQRLPSYAVFRKVYVNRDITKQLASVLRLNNEKEQKAYTIRIGSLIFHELGQLLPHQLQRFHTKESIYPIGFQTTRIYWSTSKLGRRCRYLCMVDELDKNPCFTVTVEDNENKIGQYAGCTPKEVWSYILEPVRKLREEAKMVKIFPEFMTGEDLFGLTDPSLQRIIESLPGVDTFHDYSFRFGRTPMIMAELPLAVNPTGCIRSESTRHVHLNRPVSLRTASSAPSERGDRADSSVDDIQGSMLRNNWAMTKTAQYRKMKSDWKNIVLLSKSRIQGLGLFASRDMDANTMIIEYIGSMIRNEVANKRERIYEDANRGVYMFRVDSDTVIDATMTGGPARYINHSCDPNCVAEVVIIEKMPKIIIISNRKIEKGEEFTYDYKFEFEDDQHKIACLCGAANCRKWMN